MKLRWITYVCQLGHELHFGHLVKKNGKFESGSPTVCGCGSLYVSAHWGKFRPKSRDADSIQ